MDSFVETMSSDGPRREIFRIVPDHLKASGVEPVRLPPRSPNLSPHIERFMRSLKEECLERIIFFGEKSLQSATISFLDIIMRSAPIKGSETG